MFEIVQGIAHPGMGYAHILIHLKQKDRDQPRLPVMAMDNIRVFIRLQHKLQSGLAKETKTLRIIIISIQYATVEKILEGMAFNEETFCAIHKTKIYITMKMLVIVRDP